MKDILVGFKGRPQGTAEPFVDVTLSLGQVESVLYIPPQMYPDFSRSKMEKTVDPCVEVTMKTGRTWVLACTYTVFIEALRR
jgi:hypothetical protein